MTFDPWFISNNISPFNFNEDLFRTIEVHPYEIVTLQFHVHTNWKLIHIWSLYSNLPFHQSFTAELSVISTNLSSVMTWSFPIRSFTIFLVICEEATMIWFSSQTFSLLCLYQSQSTALDRMFPMLRQSPFLDTYMELTNDIKSSEEKAYLNPL